MDELNEQQSYNSMLERFQSARNRMSLGYQTLKEENSYSQLQGRMRNRLRAWGLGYIDQESAFDKYEQMALARGDRMSRSFQHGADIGFGGANIGLNALEFMGLGSTKMSGRIGTAALGSQIAGFGGAAARLGQLASLNPISVGFQMGMTGLQMGFQNSVMDPYTNTRMFESTIYGGLRQMLGGTQSNRGFGGLDMATSLNVAKSTQNLAWMNKGVSSDQINTFLKAATEMPQLQYVQNADQAVQGISKFMDVFIKLSKQFKGKEQDMIAALQQFGQMGMSIGQSQQALMYGTRMGQFLNVSPNNISMAGVNAVQQMMNTGQLGGINQGTVFMAGAQNYTQVERMRQSGAISQVQLQNFGGTQGVANTLTNSQMNFLKSGSANLFLKAIYDPTSENGINKQMLDKMVTGQYNLGDARQRAMEITLNPKANMDFALQKDFLIGKLGADINQFTYGAWDKQFANKSPFGRDLTGRTKWLMNYQGMDEQTAMLNAQAWMNNNPLKERYLQQLQKDQDLLGNDPFYSSQTKLGVGVNTMTRGISRWWNESARMSTWSPLSYFNSESRPYAELMNSLGAPLKSLGLGSLTNFIQETTTTQSLENFTPFSKFTSPKEANETWTDILKSPDRGAGVWENASKKLQNRNMAVILASDNARDLMVDNRDRRAVREVVGNFEDDLTNKLFTKYGGEDQIRAHFNGMGTADIEKELRSSVQDFTKDKYDSESWKNLRGQRGMTYDIENILMKSAADKVLTPDKIEEYKKSMIAGSNGSGLVLNSPYANTQKQNVWNSRTGTMVGVGAVGGMMTAMAIGAGVGSIVPGAGTLIGGVIGAGVGLATTIGTQWAEQRGGERDKDKVTGFLGKFNGASGIEEQQKLYKTLQRISTYKSSDEILGIERDSLGLPADFDIANAQDLMKSFGDVKTKGSIARNLGLYEGTILPDNEAEREEASVMRKQGKRDSLVTSLMGLYGSKGYQEKALGYGAGKDFFKNVMGSMFGGKKGSTSISEGDWRKMKSNLKNTPGLGDILRDEYTVYEDGQVRFKTSEELDREGKSKKFARDRERLLGKEMGGLENYGIQKAEDIWSNRGDAAKTIQDFAVAVAKGIDIARNGGTDLKSWINVQSDADKTLMEKKEGK